MFRFIILLFLSLSLAFAGETRTWSNAEGTKSFDAEFISRDANSITLLRRDGKQLNFDISKLHKDDQSWVNQKHPVAKDTVDEELPSAHAVFDTLSFGDSRDTVAEKLKKSKFVESTVASTFLGRTGLNGIFHTSQKVGGLYCYLFFDWNEAGGLKELTLQTESKSAEDYTTVLRPCGKELIDLIGPIHGKPLQKMEICDLKLLVDGQMLATHLWKIDHGGTVMLGTAQIGNEYQVAVRFTKDEIGSDPAP